MRVLIAVHHRPPDHEHRRGDAVDGELVTPMLLECSDRASCRCDHSWAGLSTAGFADLAEIADRPNLTRAELRRAVHGLLDEIGWIDELVQQVESDPDAAPVDPVWAAERMVDEHLAHIDEICRSFPVGTVLSRLGDLVAPAAPPRAA